MAKSTIPPKIALYIDPNMIDLLGDWLKILVVKENKFSDYQLHELSNGNLNDFSKRFIKKLPSSWRSFSTESLQALINTAHKNHKAQRLGIDIDKYTKRFVIRNIAETISDVFASMGEYKVLHSIINKETNRKLTCTCNVIQTDSKLHFSLQMH